MKTFVLFSQLTRNQVTSLIRASDLFIQAPATCTWQKPLHRSGPPVSLGLTAEPNFPRPSLFAGLLSSLGAPSFFFLSFRLYCFFFLLKWISALYKKIDKGKDSSSRTHSHPNPVFLRWLLLQFGITVSLQTFFGTYINMYLRAHTHTICVFRCLFVCLFLTSEIFCISA